MNPKLQMPLANLAKMPFAPITMFAATPRTSSLLWCRIWPLGLHLATTGGYGVTNTTGWWFPGFFQGHPRARVFADLHPSTSKHKGFPNMRSNGVPPNHSIFMGIAMHSSL